MKECRRCGTLKSLNDYYKHKEMKDGHLNICIECKKSEAISTRSNKLEYYRDYDIKRSSESQRIELRNRTRIRWRAENPEKHLAHNLVSNAIKAGKLEKRPCERCGSNYRIHAHHDDYSKPLDVMWLCAAHHHERHKEIGYNL